MKTMNKIILAAGTAVVLLLGASACDRHRDPEQKAQYIVEKIDDKLELSDSQKLHLNSLKDQVLAMAEDIKSQREDSRKTIEELLSTTTLDQNQVLEMVHDSTQKVNEQAPSLVAALAAFYDSLSPEQQAIAREEYAEHMEHRRCWHH